MPDEWVNASKHDVHEKGVTTADAKYMEVVIHNIITVYNIKMTG